MIGEFTVQKYDIFLGYAKEKSYLFSMQNKIN